MKITTNNQPRELVAFEDLPESERENFDYVAGKGRFVPRFFCYRGAWYDVGEFVRAEIASWDGVQSDTYFSGVLIRYVDDCERVIVGRYYS